MINAQLLLLMYILRQKRSTTYLVESFIVIYIYVPAVQENLKVIEDSKSMQDIGAEFVVERLTACLEWEYPSDEYIKCLISEHIISGNHPSSTCKMGDPNDPMAVLDPELK